MNARLLFTVLVVSLAAMAQPPRPIRVKPEKKIPVTQALEALPDPPVAIAAETARLMFYVSPLSNKGLLSQQIRDGLKAIDKADGTATLVKIRAFVAGTGDMRRVQAIVAEDFADKKRPLPAVSTIQVGALPLEGAQVVIEAVSLEKKLMNTSGLAFFSAARAIDASEAVRQLQSAASENGVKPEGMLRVTCFLNSLDGASVARARITSAFPGAAVNLVQLTRLGVEPLAACEGTGRLAAPPPEPLTVRGPVVLVKTSKVVFTGIQMAFHPDEADIRLAVERLKRSMEALGAKDVLTVSSYALSRVVEQRVAAIQAESLSKAGTALQFEGLPSLDATVAIEAIGAVR